MAKYKIFSSLVAAISLTALSACSHEPELEKCIVNTKDNNIFVKATLSDCAASSHSCKNLNKANDPETWISVPKGQCEKIHNGDIKGLEDKLEIKK